MPKGTGRKGGMDRVVQVPFRQLSSQAFPSSSAINIAELDLVLSNLGARAVAIGSAFEWFRFKKLGAYSYTDFCGLTYDGSGKVGLVNGTHSIAWVDSDAAATGTPTTLLQMSQYEKFKGGNVREKLRLSVTRSELKAVPYVWYSTTSTGAPSNATSPGLFVFGAQTTTSTNAAGVQVFVIEGVLEFRGMITPALSLSKPAELTSSSKKKKMMAIVSLKCLVLSALVLKNLCLRMLRYLSRSSGFVSSHLWRATI